GTRWYLKYKDAAGRWQDRVCDARTKGHAVELLREIQVAEDRARNGLDKRPPRDGGGTVDAMVTWWVERFLSKRASYSQCIGTIPVTSVPKRKVPRRLPDYLRPEEIVPVLANVPDRWRCLFAAALYTGMRKGELLGLHKEDVDLKARLITIRRSHDRDTTKG